MEKDRGFAIIFDSEGPTLGLPRNRRFLRFGRFPEKSRQNRSKSGDFEKSDFGEIPYVLMVRHPEKAIKLHIAREKR